MLSTSSTASLFDSNSVDPVGQLLSKKTPAHSTIEKTSRNNIIADNNYNRNFDSSQQIAFNSSEIYLNKTEDYHIKIHSKQENGNNYINNNYNYDNKKQILKENDKMNSMFSSLPQQHQKTKAANLVTVVMNSVSETLFPSTSLPTTTINSTSSEATDFHASSQSIGNYGTLASSLRNNTLPSSTIASNLLMASTNTYVPETTVSSLSNSYALSTEFATVNYNGLIGFNATDPYAITTEPSRTFAIPIQIQILMCLMYGTLAFTAVASNTIVCYIVLSNQRMRTATNYFIVNLAVGDILMALLCIPFSFAANLIFQYWPFGLSLCVIVSYSQANSVFISAYTMVAISIDKYLAIMYPMRLRMNKIQAKIIILVIWSAALITSLPTALLSSLDSIQTSQTSSPASTSFANPLVNPTTTTTTPSVVSSILTNTLSSPSTLSATRANILQPSASIFISSTTTTQAYDIENGTIETSNMSKNEQESTAQQQEQEIAQQQQEQRKYFCQESWTFWPPGKYYYSMALMILQFVLPLFVLVITYSRIVIVVWGKRMPGEEDNARDARMARSKRKMIKMVIFCVIAFALTWLPFNALLVLGDLNPDIWEHQDIMYIWFITHFLAMCHTITNPLIYIWMNNRFRAGFKQAIADFYKPIRRLIIYLWYHLCCLAFCLDCSKKKYSQIATTIIKKRSNRHLTTSGSFHLNNNVNNTNHNNNHRRLDQYTSEWSCEQPNNNKPASTLGGRLRSCNDVIIPSDLKDNNNNNTDNNNATGKIMPNSNNTATAIDRNSGLATTTLIKLQEPPIIQRVDNFKTSSDNSLKIIVGTTKEDNSNIDSSNNCCCEHNAQLSFCRECEKQRDPKYNNLSFEIVSIATRKYNKRRKQKEERKVCDTNLDCDNKKQKSSYSIQKYFKSKRNEIESNNKPLNNDNTSNNDFVPLSILKNYNNSDSLVSGPNKINQILTTRGDSVNQQFHSTINGDNDQNGEQHLIMFSANKLQFTLVPETNPNDCSSPIERNNNNDDSRLNSIAVDECRRDVEKLDERKHLVEDFASRNDKSCRLSDQLLKEGQDNAELKLKNKSFIINMSPKKTAYDRSTNINGIPELVVNVTAGIDSSEEDNKDFSTEEIMMIDKEITDNSEIEPSFDNDANWSTCGSKNKTSHCLGDEQLINERLLSLSSSNMEIVKKSPTVYLINKNNQNNQPRSTSNSNLL